MSCPNCRTAGTLTPLSRVDDVPVHSVLLVSSEDEAASFPVGQIDLQACSYCGFVTNVAFEPEVMAYSTRYEETQGYSPTFSRFHRRLAEELIERYDLREKHVLEIGCGKGDFVTLLKQLGNNTGIGFDPAYVPERNPYDGEEGLTFVQDLYDERYTDVQADFVCCKMTLEHIREPAAFMETVRRAIGDRTDTVVFFQIPDTERILRDIAFWDVYYEHCSYFSKASLDYLFRATGFHVLNTWTDYDDQYLMIEALPNGVVHAPCPPDLEHFGFELHRFRRLLPERLKAWKEHLSTWDAHGKRVVLWGGGSKAVAFLTTLGVTTEVAAAVDINPHKAGHFLPKTAHPVVSPDELRELQPDIVLIMNPIYRAEITEMLHGLGLHPEVLDVETALSVLQPA